MGNKLDTSLARNALPSASGAPATECLSDEEVLDFASGRLQSARYQEAHLHFDQCDTCQRLLSEAAHALATAATAPFMDSETTTWNTTFQPGTLVGQRYLIRRFIARGGMGEVYEALDRDLQERVALKTVTSTACDNPRAVRLLKGEVQLSRRVSHPNVCRIYDFGSHVMPETGAQISFLTMEFVDGETLGQRLRLAGALPVDEARKLAREMLRGLSAAHDAGVLHRDFKSDNVMLRAEAGGDESSAVILDFGLARALDQDSRSGSASNPSLVGTYGYIAPEQLEGRPHSPASDVYSFGVVWFEMLTGELPFESSSSPAIAALERLQRPAAAPSTKNPLVPSDLDSIVLGCLRRSPKDRFRTPNEVLTAWDALESRTRTSFQKRRLIPLALAAAIGGFVAYLAATPAKPKLNESAHARSAKRTLEEATLPPTLSISDPRLNEPGAPEPRPPGPVPSDPHANAPGPLRVETRPLASSLEQRPSHGAATVRAQRLLPAPDKPEPPAPPTAARPAPALPDWENPFGTGGSSVATQLVDAKEPSHP
jgi:serine/threonine protein kinase